MTKALVLSGGGAVGIAWQTGLAAGLARMGVNLSDADFIVGTSAGSATGAQLALGLDMAHRVQRYRDAAAAGRPVAGTTDTPRTSQRSQPQGSRMQRLMQLMADAPPDQTPKQRRAAIGRFALEAETGPEDRFIDSFRYLAGASWPRRYACTAVDAETGEFVVWDEQSGVELLRAVASSCAVPGVFPPITINGRKYIDGGMRSGTNADLAKGHDLAVIVTLRGGARASQPADEAQTRQMQAAFARMEAEEKVLRESGARVEYIGPDEASAASFGTNLLGGGTLAPAAEAGLAQGEREAERVAGFWG